MESKETLVEHALNSYEDYLSALPNVVGLGIVSKDATKPGSRRRAVAVYVTEKKPRETLKANERIPEYLEIQEGKRKRKVPVRVIEQGIVRLEQETIGKEPL